MKDLFLGLLFAGLGATVIFIARDFPTVGGLQYGAALFPTLIGTGMIGGGLLLALGATRQLVQEHATGKLDLRVSLPNLAPLLPCLMVVGYILFSDTLGSTLCLMIVMLALFCLRGVRLIPALLTSVLVALAISYAFTHLLSVPLPKGPLGF